jgi:hypothetical protein
MAMAKYPAITPEWSHRQYGGYGDAWDEAKEQCRAALYELAKNGDNTTYGDPVPAVTAIPWPDGPFTHRGRQMDTSGIEQFERRYGSMRAALDACLDSGRADDAYRLFGRARSVLDGHQAR